MNRREFLLAAAAASLPGAAGKSREIRAAVIGGMTMTRLWQEIVLRFEVHTGRTVRTVITGQRPALAEAMRAGKVDLLTMHSGDITTDLVADGYGRNLRPWARNELVIAGPKEDPAGIRGVASGAEALRRIAAARAGFIDFHGIGSREMAHKLWRMAGVTPAGSWLLQDASGSNHGVLEFAARRRAYVIVGHIPMLFGKLRGDGVEVLVSGDPEMRRPYVVMEANPERFPEAHAAGARELADFLLSSAVQCFLAASPENRRGGALLFHPVAARGCGPACDCPRAS